MARRHTRVSAHGNHYRSMWERRVAEALVSEGVAPRYEEERLAYTTPHVYTPDFAPRTMSGKTLYIEAKGYMPSADRTKMLAVIEDNPDLDIRMVFQNPRTKLRRGSPTTYAQWAQKHGIKWGTVQDLLRWITEE